LISNYHTNRAEESRVSTEAGDSTKKVLGPKVCRKGKKKQQERSRGKWLLTSGTEETLEMTSDNEGFFPLEKNNGEYEDSRLGRGGGRWVPTHQRE